MGAEGKKLSAVLPLPAPTETESTFDNATATDLGTDVSKATENKSSYSLPEDGTPVTIKTRGHKHQRSQTSLLIEYFEAGKGKDGAKASEARKPSVRVRLTPSSKSRKSTGSEQDGSELLKPRAGSRRHDGEQLVRVLVAWTKRPSRDLALTLRMRIV